jgi:hypothetical protein
MTATRRRAFVMAFLALSLTGRVPGAVQLEDAEVHGLPHFKITTPAATYWLEKTGAGLSRMEDRDGHDWLSFDPTPGSGPGGEFRGFPNAVHCGIRQFRSYVAC